MSFLQPQALQGILNVTVESLAGHCGLSNDQSNHDIEDSIRVARLKQQLGILQSRPRAASDKIYYEFAANHLPALMNTYRQKSTAANFAMTMLNVVSHTAYFIRFQRSVAGSDLASLLASRIANAEADPDVEVIGEMCQFLSTLFVLQGATSVNEADRAKLVPKLRRWNRAYTGYLASDTSERCLGALTGDFMFQQMSRSIKTMLEQPLDQCGANCNRRVRSNASELLQCSRCKTAVYCGVPHQKQAWATHKALCFPPTF
ncbi:hypothetical protein BJ138DRAFT_1056571 [Hygrophoropsis aurantiaca]|uniref:Uncharacterized protein n=1 Tax=Hygrophoropsis aurantiaca TaxID=72124 RepID=A0ACB8AMG5_9AGAM|nr:hypothetical protein BJ138DRAFT_1056571 [Hygrophoropsis aurantiaca]